MTTNIDRVGQRVLICPRCTLMELNAGRGRGFCTGNSTQPHADRPHEEVEMVPFVRESSTKPDEGDLTP